MWAESLQENGEPGQMAKRAYSEEPILLALLLPDSGETFVKSAGSISLQTFYLGKLPAGPEVERATWVRIF
jgi:hypothetical protein